MKKALAIGFLITSILLAIHLCIINDYSINWDFHHVFFAGLYHLKHPVTNDLWHYLPFFDPDPRRMVETPFGPLQSLIPASTYTLFFEKLHMLPFDSAWNLPAVIFGVLGVLVLFLFLLETTHPVAAFAGMTFLALYPRYWGDLHTNVKDIPTATVYALSIYLAFRTVNTRKIRDIILAGLLFGITFNFKVNAIFIPIIIGLWIVVLLLSHGKKYLARPIKSWKQGVIAPIGIYFILSALIAFGIWAIFWADPYNHFAYLIRFFQYNTINMEVLLGGTWFCSGVNIPWFYPFWYLLITTPIPMIVCALIGIVTSCIQMIKGKPIASLLILWFIIPLIRFMMPQASVIDGIRHFEEVLFPLAGLSGLGAYTVFQGLQPIPKRFFVKEILIGLTLIWLAIPIVTYHPYQLSYFNEIVGGIKGAYGNYDMDYWGISQKEAVQWINKNAPPDSSVHIIMSADTAGKYLRPDLLRQLNTRDYDASDYTILLNRQSFFYRYFYTYVYILYHKPVYTVTVRGVPLAWVYNNKQPKTEPQQKWWKGEDPCIRKYW
jgi:hypothetical protein